MNCTNDNEQENVLFKPSYTNEFNSTYEHYHDYNKAAKRTEGNTFIKLIYVWYIGTINSNSKIVAIDSTERIKITKNEK